MRFTEAATIIRACRAASRFIGIVPNFQGTNGVGKTQGITHFAETEDVGYIRLYLAQSEASDVKGMPYADVAAKRTRFLLPEDLPTADLTMLGALRELATAADIDLKTVFDVDLDKEVQSVLGSDPKTARRGARRRAEEQVYESLTRVGINAMNQLRAAIALDRDSDIEGFRQALILIQGRLPRGVVHLDELNRAQPDTKQSAFGLLGEGRVGQYVLPAGWTVVVTENYEEGGAFDVANFKDAAWADRFMYLDWEVDQKFREDWAVFMARKYGEKAAGIIATCAANPAFFSKKNGQVPVAAPSPRSWEKVAALEMVRYEVPDFGDELFRLCLIGLVGAEAAAQYQTEALPVSPQEILEDGIAKHRATLAEISDSRGKIIGLMAGIIGVARPQIAKNKKYQKHSLDFAEWITDTLTENRDVVIAFLKSMLEASSDAGDANAAFRTNMVMNEQVAKLMAAARSRLFKEQPKQEREFVDDMLARGKLRDAMAVLTGKRD